jgi:hypothetical protein
MGGDRQSPIPVVPEPKITHMKVIVKDGLMGRIYRKAMERGAKVPFLSSVPPITIILVSTTQLMLIFVIVTTEWFDFQSYWCDSHSYQMPLLHMFLLTFSLLLIYLIVDGVRAVTETQILGGKFLFIFVTLFTLISGEIYGLSRLFDNPEVNDCRPYVQAFTPDRSRHGMTFELFEHEYWQRSHPLARPLCPPDIPANMGCRNSRLSKDVYASFGRQVFGPDWHPGLRMEDWRVRSAFWDYRYSH